MKDFSIVSGGQTGVDRAALDAALAAGFSTGGWCPRGRRSEDGRIPDCYSLQETDAKSYAVRTEWNVRDSDATLILMLDEISSGTRLTLRSAEQQGRPHLVVRLLPVEGGLFEGQVTKRDLIGRAVDWVAEENVTTLNVAGPRGSARTDVYERAREFMDEFLAQILQV